MGPWERWIFCVLLAKFPCARALWALLAGLGIGTRSLRCTQDSSFSSSSFPGSLQGPPRSIWRSRGFSVVMKSKRFTGLPRGVERALEMGTRSLDGNDGTHVAIFDPRESGKGAFRQYGGRISTRFGEVQRVRSKTQAHA